MELNEKIFVAGHRGLVGAAFVRRLTAIGHTELLLRGRDSLDLRRQADVNAFFAETRPDVVVMAAAKVGGIYANNAYRADFIRDNLLIQTHVIDAAHSHGVRRLLFLGSSCVYPRDCPQPIQENYLLTGPLEATNEPYAVAKIAGIKMCQAYREQYGADFFSVMPTNLYGPGDNFDPKNSHVLPALIRRFHEAKEDGRDEVAVWGTGAPRGEFLFVDDFVDACLFLLRLPSPPELTNVGVGKDLTIAELVCLIADVVGYQGEITYDVGKPDGTPRKLLDVSQLTQLGWRPHMTLRDGIETTYRWFVDCGGYTRAKGQHG